MLSPETNLTKNRDSAKQHKTQHRQASVHLWHDLAIADMDNIGGKSSHAVLSRKRSAMGFVVLAVVILIVAWFAYSSVLPRLIERQRRARREARTSSLPVLLSSSSSPLESRGTERARHDHHNLIDADEFVFGDDGEVVDGLDRNQQLQSDLWAYQFQSGDLVLMRERRSPSSSSSSATQARGGCCGTNIQISTLVAALSGSRYYHTGVIYVDPRTSQPFLWEMNESGARLASLYDMARSSPSGSLVVRRLMIGKDDRRTVDGLFEKAIRAQWRARFDYAAPFRWAQRQLSDLIAVRASSNAKGERAVDLTRYSCVSLTTALYERIGLLDMRRAMLDPRLVVAADYAREHIDERILPFQHGCNLGPLVLLVYESDAQAKGAAPAPLVEAIRRRLVMPTKTT